MRAFLLSIFVSFLASHAYSLDLNKVSLKLGTGFSQFDDQIVSLVSQKLDSALTASSFYNEDNSSFGSMLCCEVAPSLFSTSVAFSVTDKNRIGIGYSYFLDDDLFRLSGETHEVGMNGKVVLAGSYRSFGLNAFVDHAMFKTDAWVVRAILGGSYHYLAGSYEVRTLENNVEESSRSADLDLSSMGVFAGGEASYDLGILTVGIETQVHFYTNENYQMKFFVSTN